MEVPINLQQILLCPYCKKDTPELLFTLNKDMKNISAQCSCSKKDSLSFEEYMALITQMEIKEDMLKDLKLKAQCQTHSKPFVVYCNQCQCNLCPDCQPNHAEHIGLTQFTVNAPPALEVNEMDKIMKSNEDTFTEVIAMLDEEIEETETKLADLAKKKDELFKAMEKSKQINLYLKQLYEKISTTALYLKDTPVYQINKMQSTISLNLQVQPKGRYVNNYFPSFPLHLNSTFVLNQNQGLNKWYTIINSKDTIASMITLQDGRLAGLYRNYILNVWDPATIQCKSHFDTPGCHWGLRQLPDGKLASFGSNIAIWSLETNTMIVELEGHSNGTCRVIQLKDGRLVSSGIFDKKVKVWSISSKQCLSTMLGHQGEDIGALLQLSDGRLLSGSEDKLVKIWDMTSYECLHTFTLDFKVKSFVELPNGKIVFGGNEVSLYDITSNERCGSLSAYALQYLALMKDGRLVVVNLKEIWLVDPTTMQIQTKLTGHEDMIDKLIQFNDGRLATCARDKTIKIWDLSTNSCSASLNVQETQVHLCALSGSRIASGSQELIKFWYV